MWILSLTHGIEMFQNLTWSKLKYCSRVPMTLPWTWSSESDFSRLNFTTDQYQCQWLVVQLQNQLEPNCERSTQVRNSTFTALSLTYQWCDDMAYFEEMIWKNRVPFYQEQNWGPDQDETCEPNCEGWPASAAKTFTSLCVTDQWGSFSYVPLFWK